MPKQTWLAVRMHEFRAHFVPAHFDASISVSDPADAGISREINSAEVWQRMIHQLLQLLLHRIDNRPKSAFSLGQRASSCEREQLE